MTATARGAVEVRAAVRSWFWAAGPPTRAEGAALAQLVAEPADEVGGARVIDGGLRGDADGDTPVGGRWCGDPGVGHVGVGGGGGDDGLRVAGGGGDEDRGRGAWPEGGGDQVVAVAAGSAGVDDAGAGHAEPHPEGGSGEHEQQGEAGGEGAAGPAEGGAGPAGPAAFGGPVGVLVLGDQDAVAESDEDGGEEGQRRRGGGDDGEDHAQRHGAEHHDGDEEHGGQREHDGEG